MHASVGWAVATVLAMSTAPAARGQDQGADTGAPGNAPATPPTPQPRTTPKEPLDEPALAADALTRLALISIRATPDPRPEGYRLTAHAIRIAERFRPADADLVRLECDAWAAAGDQDRAHEATARILRLDPTDTVAQLRLLTDRIRRLQIAEDRVKLYDRLLGEEGRALDPAVRSRLALDAALLVREMGDEAGFVSRLTQATTLDPTNKGAAAMYATYFLDRTENARERVDMLANVLLADPVDPNASANLASELMRRGAFKAGLRFLDRAQDCMTGTGVSLSLSDWMDRLLAVWMAEGDAACLKEIQKLQDNQQAVNEAEQRRRVDQGETDAQVEEALLPPTVEGYRIAIGFATGDEKMAVEAARRTGAFTDRTLDSLAKKEPPFDKVTDERRAEIEAQAKLETAAAFLWAGAETEKAAADIEALAAREDRFRLEGKALDRFRALVALRRGDAHAASEVLAAMPDDDRLAQLGLGMALEAEGRTQDAVRAYARLALHHANTQIAGAARRRIETILGKPLAPTPEAQALEAWSKGFASPWLDEMTRDPQNFMRLSAAHVKTTVDVFDRVEVRIRLRNVSRWPLAMGPEAPINSRLMLSPQAVIQGKPPSMYAQPEVVDLDRRLRLMPGEDIEAVVWANRASIGTLLELYCTSAVTLRWRVLQGYRVDAERRFINGLMCTFAETDPVFRTALENIEDPAALAERMGRQTGRELLETLLMAGATSLKPPPGTRTEQDIERRTALAGSVASRLPVMNEYERCFALSALTRSGLFHAGTVLVDAARGDPSPLVQATLMLGIFKEPKEPRVAELVASTDPEIAAMATILREAQLRAQASPPVPAEKTDESPQDRQPGAATPPDARP